MKHEIFGTKQLRGVRTITSNNELENCANVLFV